MVKENENFSIRFYNMGSYVKTYQVDKWTTLRYIKSAAYYRIFIPDIMRHFDKVIYLDADLILNNDISQLYKINDNYAIAAARDIYVSQVTSDNEFVFPGLSQYAKDTLKISDLKDYFNSGVMLLNIKKINTQECLNKLIAKAQENNCFFHDQNVFNSVFNKNVKILDESWNTQINSGKDILSLLFMKELSQINIIHFCSKHKPWLNVNMKYSYLWWHYARMTPFYEEILFKNLNSQNRNANNAIDLTLVRETANYLKNKITYWRYRLLSKITFGKKRRKYKQKRKELKTRLKQVRAFLKGK